MDLQETPRADLKGKNERTNERTNVHLPMEMSSFLSLFRGFGGVFCWVWSPLARHCRLPEKKKLQSLRSILLLCMCILYIKYVFVSLVPSSAAVYTPSASMLFARSSSQPPPSLSPSMVHCSIRIMSLC